MPEFHPPLEHTSVIPVRPSDQGQNFAHLSFFATFTPDEDPSGNWEIWTDLPLVDDVGQVKTAEGDWRAISFLPVEKNVSKGVTRVKGDAESSIPTIRLAANDSAPTSSVSSDKILYASVIIPATSRTYTYTFRRVWPSGDMQWLGWEGGNGVVSLQEQQGQAEEGNVAPEDAAWQGFGVRLNRATRPDVFAVPTDDSTSPSFVVLSAKLPLHRKPFSRLSSTAAAAPPTAPTWQIAYISNSSNPITLPPSQAHPDNLGEVSVIRQRDGSLREVLEMALKSSVDFDGISLANVKFEGELVALNYVSSNDQDSVLSYPILLGPGADGARVAIVELPQGLDLIPRVLDCSTDRLFVSPDAKAVCLGLPAGPVSKVLALHNFTELRGVGGNDSIFLFALEAVASEVGEEEMEAPVTKPTVHPIPTAKSALDDPMENREAPVQREESGSRERTPELETPPAIETSDGPVSRGWWLFRVIGRFFLRLWSMILLPLPGGAIKLPDGDRPEQVNEEEDEDEAPEVRTPAGERTPLLDGTDLSRSTSTTAFSPPGSPTSTTTAKPHVFGITDLVDLTPQTPPAHVQIRSYGLFTFAKPPPFKFLLPPGSGSVEQRVKLSLRQKGEAWRPASTDYHPALDLDSRCDEMLIHGTEEGGEGPWEVQVERI